MATVWPLRISGPMLSVICAANAFMDSRCECEHRGVVGACVWPRGGPIMLKAFTKRKHGRHQTLTEVNKAHIVEPAGHV